MRRRSDRMRHGRGTATNWFLIHRAERPARDRRYGIEMEAFTGCLHRATLGSYHIMAKQIVTLLTDDIDGSDADRTVEFGLDGINYTIDLSEKNSGKLYKALDPYLAVASRVG